MTAPLPALLRSFSAGVARKADLGYININEQIKKGCLAQTPEDGEKGEGKKKGTA
jgi:hypothetical protein